MELDCIPVRVVKSERFTATDEAQVESKMRVCLSGVGSDHRQILSAPLTITDWT